MIYLILWVVLCILVGAYASSKNRSFIGFMLLALILSPLIVFLIVALIGAPDSQKANNLRKCPACAESIQKDASFCRFCGNKLEESPKAVEKSNTTYSSGSNNKSGLDI